ncbi:hypothetical protein ABTK51_20460, partial [Acinetobacter baumannii]
DAWWAALRRQTVAGGDHLALSAELLPPAAAAAWQRLAMPDVRARPGAAVATPEGGYEMRWDRLHVPPGGNEALALYLPRLD